MATITITREQRDIIYEKVQSVVRFDLDALHVACLAQAGYREAVA